MHRALWCVVVLTAVIAVAGVTSEVLVFKDGSRLDGVEAELKADLVWVTLASGAMQAYPAEEVDLEASGLLAEPTPTPAPEADRPEISGGTRLIDARAKSTGKSSLMITDADVDHVAPEELQPEEGTGVGAEGPLKVSEVTHSRVGDKIQVLGVITNTTYRPVSNVVVEAAAADADGRQIGKGQQQLGKTLEPQGKVNFKVWIEGEGVAAEVRARAQVAGRDRGPRARRGDTPPTGQTRGRPAGRGGEG